MAIFRALNLGDVLCAVPALRALKKLFPAAETTFIGLPWARSLCKRLAYVDHFWEFPGFPGIKEKPLDWAQAEAFFARTRGARFDLAIQMHGDGRVSNHFVRALGAAATAGYHPATCEGSMLTISAPYPTTKHEIYRCLGLVELLGGDGSDPGMEFPLSTDDFVEIGRRLSAGEAREIGPLVALHAGANAIAKRWPADRFARVGEFLHERYRARLFLTGGQREVTLVGTLQARMRAPAINLAGKTSLGGLAALISRLDLLVTNDSGPSHIAAAVGTNSVVIFGSADPHRWAPLDRKKHLVLHKTLDSVPYAKAPYSLDDHRINAITISEVCEAAASLLDEWSPARDGHGDLIETKSGVP